jgi:hypothetical protein
MVYFLASDHMRTWVMSQFERKTQNRGEKLNDPYFVQLDNWLEYHVFAQICVGHLLTQETFVEAKERCKM